MAGQGPAVPLIKYIHTQRTKVYTKSVCSEMRRALQTAEGDILNWGITELCVCTCGHETQPPEERGQYGICTEHVKKKYNKQDHTEVRSTENQYNNQKPTRLTFES